MHTFMLQFVLYIIGLGEICSCELAAFVVSRMSADTVGASCNLAYVQPSLVIALLYSLCIHIQLNISTTCNPAQ